ncbi:MAG: malto-oligosyltrehalose synthase [Gammaproteobacteria bacterium]|nr:malto-oligosyltrehalose synthase [Gammaproteobacteria bacterium]
MNEPQRLEELAAAVGLATAYTDIAGTRHEATPVTLKALLEGLGYAVDGSGAADALVALEAEYAREPAPAVAASFEPAPPRLALNPAALAGSRLEWRLTGEAREAAGACAIADLEDRGTERVLMLPPLAPGYYRVSVRAGVNTSETLLIRAPARAWWPETPLRGYGFAIQLYEQLGPASIGLGDFGDLAGLGEAAGAMGATILGLNPLHAPFLAAPGQASPYSPSSRLALNPLYLDVRSLPGLNAPLRERLASPAFAARIAALNAQPRIDYPAVTKLKLRIAREAFANFRAAGGDPAFAAFCGQPSAGIAAWARHETVAAEFGADFRHWPAALRAPESSALERFIAERREVCDFFLWLQWQAAEQLAAAAGRARAGGLGLGFYRDLALGADPAGAEVWAGGKDFAMGLAVGAPPDPLNPRGQNWGFPPLHPRRLCVRRLTPFIELLRANMRHAGALRLDHVLGLNRLFVIPPGVEPVEGTYLRYPLEPLLAAIVLESQRAHCLVIGEDLGTVPEGLRNQLAARGILSLRLLYFERGETGQPRAPEDYPREALTMAGTHDLPPLAGWWAGADLARTDRLGLWPSTEAREAAHAARPGERAVLRECLRRAGLPGAEAEPPAAAVYRWLARTPSRLLAIQPEDALGIADPVNVPGTTDEEPNWCRRRLPPWPQWLSDPRFIEVLRGVQQERGKPAPLPRSALIATYRLQLNKQFGFRQAAAIVPYLARLGVSHLYLSPVMSAVPGSAHGYDMTDPARLDADRGGPGEFAALLHVLRLAKMQAIIDFVPNHMGADAANPWWMDLLEWGHASVHDASFDVDWSAEVGRLTLPILGAPLETVLARGEIRVNFEPSGRFCATYFSHRLPLAPASTAGLVRLAGLRIGAPEATRLTELARRLRALATSATETRRAAGLALEAELATLAEHVPIADALDAAAAAISDDANRVARLLERQVWRPVHWRRGPQEINYRRFFDITDLAALRMERPVVFAAVHAGIRSLLAMDGVAGLRLDHVDGLAAPGRYLETLHELAAAQGGAPLWVEKILAADEALCPWPVAGTTGYEFLNTVTRVFVPAAGADRLRALWGAFVPDARPFTEALVGAKCEAVTELFAPMLDRIVAALAARAPVAPERLREALTAFVIALPVYRAYADAPPAARAAQEAIVARAAAAIGDAPARTWLVQLLALRDEETARLPAPLRDGVAHLWQLAATAMAKGLEDTAFYRDFGLLALNEVGGDPRVAAITAEDVHARMRRRARDWPAALNASTTHDTKRGEDARLRLAMLAAHAQDWQALVPRLRAAAARMRPAGLHPADEYLVWQTLLAIWPPPADAPPDAERCAEFSARLREYLTKALREGKLRSSWLAPDIRYEAVVGDYAEALLDPARGGEFQRGFLPFAGAVARSGALAGLAALTLKCTAPGVPDVYQGSELWDFTLVDPDNRRAVDFVLRERLLAEFSSAQGDRPINSTPPVHGLLHAWPDGRVKLYILACLLALRRRYPQVFTGTSYQSLAMQGPRAGEVLAFERAHAGTAVRVFVARVSPGLMDGDRCALAAASWGDTRCVVEDSKTRTWRELFTGRKCQSDEFIAARLLSPLPAAVLLGTD